MAHAALEMVIKLVDELKEELAEMLKTSEGYAEVDTTVEGLSVAVLPKKGNREKSIAVVLKPAGSWKGVYLRSRQQLESLRALVNSPKTEQLIAIVEELSPPAKVERRIKI